MDKLVEHQVVFKYKVRKTEALKLGIEVLNQSTDVANPLRVTVRFNRGSTSWKVPFREANIKVNSINQTLCLLDEVEQDETELVAVFSTSSPNKIPYEFSLKRFLDFYTTIGLEQKQVVNVQPGSPALYYVDLGSIHQDLIHVKVTSEENNVCGLISVQAAKCPISLVEDNMASLGSWQTMLNLGAYTIQASDYSDGFFIAFLTLKDDSTCGSSLMPTQVRQKSFSFQITNPDTNVVLDIVLSTLIIFGIALLIFIAAYCYIAKGLGAMNKIS